MNVLGFADNISFFFSLPGFWFSFVGAEEKKA